jgi:hypothetical protein
VPIVATNAGAGFRTDDDLTAVAEGGKSVFYQIDSSGRKNIAASDTQVAIIWETVRSGKSTVNIAFKTRDEDSFSAPIPVSEHSDAFSPSIASCGEGFVVTWIAGNAIRVRTADASRLGAAVTLAEGPVNEVSMGCKADAEALVAWSAPAKEGSRVFLTPVELGKETLLPKATVEVAPFENYKFQTNPGVAYAGGRYIVTWHDRSSGTNLLFASSSTDSKGFTQPVQINEWIQKSDEWGKGSSAIRNSLSVTRDGKRAIITWLDKRGSRSGYKVYGTFSDDGGMSWGANYKIGDDFSDDIPQWSLSLAADPNGRAAAVWMDSRYDENAIWLSQLYGISWSDDIELSDDNEYQPRSPAVAMGPDGTLHAIWIEGDAQQQGMRIVYRSGHDR